MGPDPNVASPAPCPPGTLVDLEQAQILSPPRWRAAIASVAQILDAQAIGAGDTLLYAGTNHPIVWALMGATAELGATLWPANYRWTAPEFRQALKQLSQAPSLIIADTKRRPALASRGLDAPLIGRDELWSQALSEAGKNGLSVASGDKGPSPVLASQLLMTTSGTTGAPKFVGLPASSLQYNAKTFAQMTHLQSHEPVLVCAPNFHVAGASALTVAAFYRGAPLVVARRFEPTALLAAIDRWQIRATLMVPTMWKALMDCAESTGSDLSTLRFGICGGAPMDAALVARAHRLGFDLLQGYGMTEAGPMVTLMSADDLAADRQARAASAGRAAPGLKVAIIDDQKRPLPPGKPGQIAIAGPAVARGYLNDPQSTAAAFDDPWFFSGDQGRLDAAGFLYVEGRLDDRIITGGENVAPAEVEAALRQMSAVDDAAVFGIDHPHWGQQVVALIAAADATKQPTLSAVQTYLRPHLAAYKLPRQLRFVANLPTTAAGKLDRSQLAARWQMAADPSPMDRS